MNEALNGEIIEQKFPDIDHELQDVADMLEILLKDFDSFPVKQSYTYKNGVVSFDISCLTDEEREEIIHKTNSSNPLQNLFTISTGSKVDDNGSDVVILFLEKK